MALPDFISDADMAAFETPSPSGGSGFSAPDFIPDDQLHVYEGTQAPSREAPSFFSDPIGAIAGTSDWSVSNLVPNLTSADWWMTRPSGEKISAAQGIAGPLQNTLSGMTFGLGDEITAGGNSIVDFLTGGPGYDARLEQARGVDKSFEEASPIGSFITGSAGALKSPILNLATKLGALLPAAKTLPQAAARTGALTTALAGEGALLGGAYGFGEGEGGLGDRLTAAKDSAKTSATISGLLGAPLVGLSEIGTLYKKPIEDMAKGLFRKSRGARASDYAKSAKELDYWDITDDQVKTATSEALDTLEKKGILGTSTDPNKTLTNVLKEEKKLGTSIDTIIKNADEAGVRNHPKFEEALNYLIEGKIPADQVDSYLEKLEKLSDAIKQKGGGKLSYLQQQKIAAGSKYNPDDGAANGFWRAVYSDIQKTIEESVPDIGPLNQSLRDIKITKPIFQRAMGTTESSNFVDALFERLRTSGAKTVMGPALGATAMFGFGAGLPAATAAGVAGHFMTPKGQQQLGRILNKLSRNSGKPLSHFEKMIRPLAAQSGAEASEKVKLEKQSRTKARNTGLSLDTQNELRTKSNQGSSVLPRSSINSDKEYVASKVKSAEAKMEDPKPPVVIRANRVDSEEFHSKVKDIAKDLGAKPEHLMKVMSFETGGTLDPKQKNKAGSGATGLIQFMPKTAKELTGAHSEQAAIKLMEEMSPTQQLDYVKKHLSRFKGKLNTLADVYMAVLYPKAVGKDSQFALFREKTKAYWQNRGLDLNKDGIITKEEAAKKVETYKV